ncbi:MAG: hypothetical protein AAB675_03350 [Patescibacteria group bacterium]
MEQFLTIIILGGIFIFIWSKIAENKEDIKALRSLGGDVENIEVEIDEIKKEIKEIKRSLKKD